MQKSTCCLRNITSKSISDKYTSVNHFLKDLAHILRRVDTDARAHGRGNHTALDVLTLCGGRLRLYDRAEQRVKVLRELLLPERHLAHRAVDDVRLIQTVLNLSLIHI